MKKIIIIFLLIGCSTFLGVTISANLNYNYTGISNLSSNIGDHDVNSNFFTQVDSKENLNLTEEIKKQEDFLTTHNYSEFDQVDSDLIGYEEVARTDDLILYLYEDTISIAITDRNTGYTWFSNYYKQDDIDISTSIKASIESGVTIEYYNASSSIVHGNNSSSFTQGKKVNFNVTLNDVKYTDYQKDNKKVGFIAAVNFVNLGISFNIEVYLDNDQLVVNVPHTSVKEVGVGKDEADIYLLRTISLFPYLGSQNHEINGYTFLPDGSGSLVRYTDQIRTSLFNRPLYGNDYGYYNDPEFSDHLTDPYNVTLPIYGISHGYNQNAILAQVTSGFGQASLISSPYGYSNILLDRTNFKFSVRHDSLFNLSSGSVSIINENIYQNDCTVVYDFLSEDNANYIGMANKYRETLNLDLKEEASNIPLHLDVLAKDYKPGLFGKDFVDLTTYEELENIVDDLLNSDVNNISLNYFGANKNGYFTKTSDFKSYSSKGKLEDLNTYFSSKNVNLSMGINPVITTEYGFLSDAIKKPNYEPFAIQLNSSIETTGYYNDPSVLSENVNSILGKLDSTNINSLTVYDINSTYSFLDSKLYSKEDMINILTSELNKLEVEKINAHTPNDYLFEYIERYLDAPYESSKYAFQTDSIPFITILLSGYVDMFMPNINYISNYDLMNLRMVEYNLYPSFVLTSEESFKLRYTNFEYLNSTEYSLWSDLIVSTYSTIDTALSSVYNSVIVWHEYIAPGVALVKYSNGVNIYINYTNQNYTIGNINKTINAMNYLVEVE